mmetsp:Transcript_4606/g.12858  ORF Transcript_4606/g.12858 Transcript_4606/m.12858 type:complete len:532 (+) Transcript_4606:56-1651(+)
MINAAPLLLPIPARTPIKKKWTCSAWSAAVVLAAGVTLLVAAVAASALALLAVKAINSAKNSDEFVPPPRVVWEALDVAREFRLTQQSYAHGVHIEACSSEFGPAYQIADWEHDLGGRSLSARVEDSAPSDLGRLSEGQVRNLSDSLRIPTSFNSRFYFVDASSQSGQTSPRTYHYFERHDGHVPADFVASDQHGGLSLSSCSPWRHHQNMTGKVLCVKRALTRVDEQPAVEALAHAPSWIAPTIVREFRFTEKTYTAQSHSEACTAEFGMSFHSADWSHDLASLSAQKVGDFGEAMGLLASPGPRFFIVSDQGWQFPAQLNYTGAFFFARREVVDLPEVFAQHGPFVLSASQKVRGPVLCVKKTGEAGSPVGSAAPSSYSSSSSFSRLAGPGGAIVEVEGESSSRRAGGRHFRLTRHRYKVLEESVDDMCSGEYGPSYEVADWTVDLGALSAEQVETLTENLGIPVSLNARFYLVTDNGKARHGWDYYYFERHGGGRPPPPGFRRVAEHGPLALGHAEYVDGPALCVYRG